MEIVEIKDHKKAYISLLLIADEQEERKMRELHATGLTVAQLTDQLQFVLW